MRLRSVVRLVGLGLGPSLLVVAGCSGEPVDGANSQPQAGASGAGTTTAGNGNGAGSGVGGGGTGNLAGGANGGMPGSGGSLGIAGSGGAPVVVGGSGGAANGGASPGGAAGSGGSAGGGNDNPGNYPPPPRDINVTGGSAVNIGFAPSAADPGASGSQHWGVFDPKKKLQKKLVLPFGGVNSDPWKMGWAVERGYHVLTVDLWNDYPKDPGYPEYLESWSGDDLSQTLNQPKNNSVMARVKAGLKYLNEKDPGSDWGYYLDAQGEVRWNDVILFGYSWGGQLGVAASKYVAMDRIIITSAPNVPIDSPWLKQPAKTPPQRCFFLGGNKDGEHNTHKAETLLLGWPGDVINVTHLAPPYASNRLEVDDGHSSFCGRPFNDGMIDWDGICEWLFHTQK
jgi:hypothetical protein